MTQDPLPKFKKRREAYSRPFADHIQAEIAAIPKSTIYVIFEIDTRPMHMPSLELIERHAQAYKMSLDLLHHLQCYLHLPDQHPTFLMIRQNWMNAQRLTQILELELFSRTGGD